MCNKKSSDSHLTMFCKLQIKFSPFLWPSKLTNDSVCSNREIHIYKKFLSSFKSSIICENHFSHLWETHWSQVVSTLVIRSSDLGLRSEQQDILGKTIVLSQCFLSQCFYKWGTGNLCVGEETLYWKNFPCHPVGRNTPSLFKLQRTRLMGTRLKHRSLHKSAKNREEN